MPTEIPTAQRRFSSTYSKLRLTYTNLACFHNMKLSNQPGIRMTNRITETKPNSSIHNLPEMFAVFLDPTCEGLYLKIPYASESLSNILLSLFANLQSTDLVQSQEHHSFGFVLRDFLLGFCLPELDLCPSRIILRFAIKLFLSLEILSLCYF